MPPTFGGETPLVPYAGPLTLTVEAPTGTSEAVPVEQGDLFKISGTAADGSGYKLAALIATDTPILCDMVMALHRMTTVREMGVVLISNRKQVRRLKYVTGVPPTLGQSIIASSTNFRRIAGAAWANGNGRVMLINAADLDADVLI